jgi:hypothetical protein
VLTKLQAGDTLFFRHGEYMLTEEIRPLNSGTEKQPIVICAVPGERVIFNGINYTDDVESGRIMARAGKALFNIEGVSYLKLIGIEVRHSRNIGILIKGKETTFIELIDCKSHGSYNSGIGLWYCRNVKVLHCEITGANDQEYRTTQPLRREAPHEALTIAGAENFEIAWNHLHSCDKEGIDCKEVSAHGVIHHNLVHDIPRQGIYADCWFGLLEDVEIHSNIVFACEWGIAFSAEGKDSNMKNIRVHHNIVFENRASGILFGVWGQDTHRENIQIHNNTIWRNGSPAHWAGKTGGIDIRSRNISNVMIYNNIVAENWAFEIGTTLPVDSVETFLNDNQIIITNNLIQSNTDVSELKGMFDEITPYNGKSVIIANPEFNDPGKFDFSLKPSSPAWKNYIVPKGSKADKFVGALGKINDFRMFY